MDYTSINTDGLKDQFWDKDLQDTNVDSTDLYFTPSDAIFNSILNNILDAVTNLVTVNTVMTASSVQVFSDEFLPVCNFLYQFLPFYLKNQFGINYSEGKGTKFWKKTVIKSLCDNMKVFLTEHKKSSANINLVLKGLPLAVEDIANLDYLTDFVNELKKKYAKTLKGQDKKLFNYFYKVYGYEALDDKAIHNVLTYARYIQDNNIKLLIRSIDHKYASIEKNFAATADANKKATLALFGTENPSIEQLQKVAAKSPTKYKEWRKGLNETTRQAKILLEEAWVSKKWTVVPVDDVRALLKKLSIKDTIDNGFKGKIGLGSTPGMLFTYHNMNGIQIEGTPGTNVIMNAKYDADKDDCYVCTALPAGSFTNKRYRFYTVESVKKRSSKGFTASKNINNVIEDCRIQFDKDIKESKGKTKLYALVCKLADLSCGRIGNFGSEKRGVYGLHNLKIQHISFKGDKLIIEYVGKGKITQKHIITDSLLFTEIKKLCTGRKKTDYVFSKDGSKSIHSNTINKYLKEIGFSSSFHKFRKYHASRMFSDFIAKNSKKNMQPKTALEEFKKAIESIAEKLGNTSAVVVKSYVDPELMTSYFKKYKVDPPKTIKAALEKSYLGLNDQDEDDG